MSNRSRFVAATAGSAALAVGAVARARRRARVANATQGVSEVIMPSVLQDTPFVAPRMRVGDEAHAPGHQHLQRRGADTEGRRPKPMRVRPFAKHQHGSRHPGR